MIKINKIPSTLVLFDDDDVLINAIKKANEKGYNILDCFTPFPIHGIEKVLGIKRSNLAVAAFAFGAFGFTCAMTLMTYAFAIDWPVDIGGKPTWPLTSMIPILFELTVLIGSLGMAFTYFWVNGMFPGVEPVIYEKRTTSDRFLLIIENENRASEIKDVMQQHGAVEIREDDYISHNFPGPVPFKLK